MLSEQEVEEIKQNIISQIESTFPEEQIENARKQIEEMNPEELERFLEKNKLIKNEEVDSNPECVFCSIASKKIKSCEIGENEEALAVLEINPISKGHTIIVPKNHDIESSKGASKLTEEISKKIKRKLNPKEIKTSKSKLFGHEIINVLPVYANEDFNSERKKASLEELEKIKEEIEKKSGEKIKKPKIEKIKELLWLPKRIP
jgi:histidine triad (HIT) family protein